MNYKVLMKLLIVGSAFFMSKDCKAGFDYTSFVDKNIIFNGSDEITGTSIINSVDDVAPVIATDLKPELEKIDFKATKIDFNPYSYNFIIFYQIKDGKNVELFRQKIDYSGKGEINDSKVLSSIKNNMVIFARVESFIIDNGQIKRNKISNSSINHYTPKVYELEIKELSKVVYNDNLIIDKQFNQDGTISIPTNYLRKYIVDKFFTYEGSQVTIDDDIADSNKDILLKYNNNKITVELATVKNEWINVTATYPTIFKKHNITLSEKKDTPFKQFLNINLSDLEIVENENYRFLGFFINNQSINTYTEKLSTDMNIEARFDTKILIKTDNNSFSYFLPTGTNLKDLNFKAFERDGYFISSYKIINNETGEEKEVTTLDKEFVLDSVTIIPQYKVKTNKIEVRQDEYNSRFGQVTNGVNQLNVDWGEIKPIGELLEQLKKDIIPNEGYELQFRINKKVVTPESFITKDSLLEIYFKRIEDSWITVKFLGDGIDRFLTDGQEVLVGYKLDNINLPTSTGVSNKLLGWEVNNDYFVEKESKKFHRTKDTLLSNGDLPFVTAQKGKNLLFNAIYEKIHKISFYNEVNGNIIFYGNDDIKIASGKTIASGLNGKNISIMPNNHYKFLYFTSTLPVTVIRNGQQIIIPTGEKIYLEDFYNILVDKNLTFIPKFVFQNGLEDNIIDGNNHSFIYDTIERNYSKNLNDALGPLKYLL